MIRRCVFGAKYLRSCKIFF